MYLLNKLIHERSGQDSTFKCIFLKNGLKLVVGGIYQGKHKDGSNHFAKYILVVLLDKTLNWLVI